MTEGTVKLPHREYCLWSHDPADPTDSKCLPVEFAATNSIPARDFPGKLEERIDDHLKMIGPVEDDHYYLVIKANRIFISCLN